MSSKNDEPISLEVREEVNRVKLRYERVYSGLLWRWASDVT